MRYEFIFPIRDVRKVITSDSETELDILRISVKKPFFLGRNTFLIVHLLFHIDHGRHENSKQGDKCQTYGTVVTPHFGGNFFLILWGLGILRKSVFSLNFLKRVP